VADILLGGDGELFCRRAKIPVVEGVRCRERQRAA
jgi:hypothetical protein